MSEIAIAGTGYVGLSHALLLAQYNEVVARNIVLEKVVMLNVGKSPIEDDEVTNFLDNSLTSGPLSRKKMLLMGPVL